MMLAFMAYPPSSRARSSAASVTENSLTASTKTPSDRNCNDSVTTASIEERPPQSFLSLNTEASWEDDESHHRVRGRLHPAEESDRDIHRRANTCFGMDRDATPQRKNTAAVYIERIYENTVHGPCQTVTMCEVEHLDLFMNCQQPLSFLGFGHHPASTMDRSYHDTHQEVNYHHEEELPLPGAYDVPKGCEYCGAVNTKDCIDGQCRRPKLFFHKKRPPFAPRDDTKWDPKTDLAVRTGTTPRKKPTPHTQRY